MDEKGRPIAAKLIKDGSPVEIGGVEKMAKSKNNGVDPQALMFAAPPEQQLEWSGAGVEGASRFLRRLWIYASSQAQVLHNVQTVITGELNTAEKDLRFEVHTILKQANFDYQRRQYNTVVSAAMKMLNVLEPIKLDGASQQISPAVLSESLSILLRILYPVVPHCTYVLWQELGFTKQFGSLLDAPWPTVDESAL
ncbi:MAG: hypothetical protein RIR08_1353, partial [Pseudomonadota bacterium]